MIALWVLAAWLACEPLPCEWVCEGDARCEEVCELSDVDIDARECPAEE